ncbi:hypothetical protein [Streptomyces phaeoluteigriseus]|uniref:hypothetical protein n=1 Tax=Streptomyces phaeoluteigriseus TaxID=114686 RepID=UPI00117F0C13|nr:hypothetical protein [Streptomyces phaeoluteigriseus]
MTDAPGDVFHLGLLRDARRVCVCVGERAEIAAHYSRLEVLVDNAGLHAFAQRITSEGFADKTAVNCLGPFVLPEALKAKAGRLSAGTERQGLRSGSAGENDRSGRGSAPHRALYPPGVRGSVRAHQADDHLSTQDSPGGWTRTRSP